MKVEAPEILNYDLAEPPKNSWSLPGTRPYNCYQYRMEGESEVKVTPDELKVPSEAKRRLLVPNNSIILREKQPNLARVHYCHDQISGAPRKRHHGLAYVLEDRDPTERTVSIL